MEDIKLNAEKREGTGKGPARRLRANGFTPAILYGPDTEPSMLSINSKDLARFFRQYGMAKKLIQLTVTGENEFRPVIVRDLQRDPVTGNFDHLDLYQVSMNKTINVTVPVTLVGTPSGQEQGGITQQIIRELEIICLPGDIPNLVELDISELNIGDSLHVSDITIEKVEILTEPRRAVVTVVPPTVIKTETVEEEEGELAEGEEGELAEGEEGEAAEGEAAEGKEGQEKKEEGKE